jgi:hypothetical protein
MYPFGGSVSDDWVAFMKYCSSAADHLPKFCWVVGGIVLLAHGERLADRLSPVRADGETPEGPATPSAALAVVFAAVGVYFVLRMLAELPRTIATLGLWHFWDLFGPEGVGLLKRQMLTSAITGGLRIALTLVLGLVLTYKAARLAAKFCERPWLTDEGAPGWGARALGLSLRVLGVYLFVLGAVGLAGGLASIATLYGIGWTMPGSLHEAQRNSDWGRQMGLMPPLTGLRIVLAAGQTVSRGLLLVLALWLVSRADRVAQRLVGGHPPVEDAGAES